MSSASASAVSVDSESIALLAADLTSAGFSGDVLSDLWGVTAAEALHRGHRVPALRALAAAERSAGTPSALATLARLFVLNVPVDTVDLDAALPTLGSAGAVALALAQTDDGGASIRPLLDLRPYSFVDAHGVGSWWIVSDLGEVALGHALPEDHVLGVGGASTTLSGLMMQRAAQSVLDLGTGCGIQALHASRHAARVVATDISERALAIARFNAQLNAVTNIEFRLGSLYEPVAGERFDHIVSNPPFVITPHSDGVPLYEYRDGGLVGDSLVERVVRGAADHLTVGGIAQLLGNWEYRRGEGAPDGLERVGEWIDSAGLDGWVIEREVQNAALYAETWIRDGGTRPGARFDELTALWLDDFDARGVESVGFGYLTVRRPGDDRRPTLRRLERLHGVLGHNATGLGEHLAESLDAFDWQEEQSDDELAQERLVASPDVTEERHYWPGAEDPTVMTLHQGSGFGRAVPLDTTLAAFVGVCDGELTTEAIVVAIAELLGADAAALREHLLPSIRELLTTGFLRLQ